VSSAEPGVATPAIEAELLSEPPSVSLTVAPDPGPTHLRAPRSRERRGLFSHGRTWFLVGVDAVAIAAALAITYGIAEAVAAPAIIAPTWLTVVLAVLAVPVWIAIFTVYNLYERQNRSISLATFDEVGELFHALLAGSLLFLITSQVLRRVMGAEVYFPVEAAMFCSTALPLVLLLRGSVRSFVFPSVMHPRRTLIVGSGSVGQVVERKIRSHPEYGLELVGFVDEKAETDGDTPVLGRPGELPRLVDTLEIDWVILAFAHASYEETLDLLRAARRPDVHLSIVPRFFEVFASNATIQDLEGMPVVNLPSMRLSRSVRFLKRAVDITVSAAGLIVLSPLLAITALAIKLDSRGPVFFRQERHGRGGSVFRIAKFRTMEDGAEAKRQALAHSNEVDGALFKIKDDPRVTRVGRILRPASIDELPQLWNVLKGEMSLVGPRPFVIHESSQIKGWASRRLDLTPGITGLWQVLGRNDMPFDEMVKLDYIYVTNWSLWWDLKILCQTIPVVLKRRGAY
jgi:exopolysaccharide biosynthesis polyprenyl glycosylphosphotransferase